MFESEIRRAIEDSLKETEKGFTTVTDALKTLRDTISSENGNNYGNIDRKNVLDGLCRALSRKRFPYKKTFNVKFMDEEGVDAGGPQRQMRKLAVREIERGILFQGLQNKKTLSYNLNALADGRYQMCGKILALAVVHGDIAPKFFSQVFCDVIAKGPESVRPTLGDVLDDDAKRDIKKLAEATTVNEMNEVLNSQILLVSGCTYTRNLMQKDNLVGFFLFSFYLPFSFNRGNQILRYGKE